MPANFVNGTIKKVKEQQQQKSGQRARRQCKCNFEMTKYANANKMETMQKMIDEGKWNGRESSVEQVLIK